MLAWFNEQETPHHPQTILNIRPKWVCLKHPVSIYPSNMGGFTTKWDDDNAHSDPST